MDTAAVGQHYIRQESVPVQLTILHKEGQHRQKGTIIMLNQPIRLGMVRGSARLVNMQKYTQFFKQRRLKVATLVGVDTAW